VAGRPDQHGIVTLVLTQTARTLESHPTPVCGVSNRKAIVQLTIDSSESIDKVLPAVGAMFGVEVQVSSSSTATGTAAREETRPTRGRRNATKRTPQKSATTRARASKSDDSALVREWALANGYHVADRGRISAAIRDAYRAA